MKHLLFVIIFLVVPLLRLVKNILIKNWKRERLMPHKLKLGRGVMILCFFGKILCWTRWLSWSEKACMALQIWKGRSVYQRFRIEFIFLKMIWRWSKTMIDMVFWIEIWNGQFRWNMNMRTHLRIVWLW